jgi:hypothetical protein
VAPAERDRDGRLRPAPAATPVAAVPAALPLAAGIPSADGSPADGCAAAGGTASGGPAGRVTARRVRRAGLPAWLLLSPADPDVPAPPPDPIGPSADSLFSRSISSIRAFSPVRLPGAGSLNGPLRATRELFVRAGWSGSRRTGVPRYQARCHYLSLFSAPPVWPGRLRLSGRLRGAGPVTARQRCRSPRTQLVSRDAGTRCAGLCGGSINAQRPLSQPRHHSRRRRLQGRHVTERNQNVFGSYGRCHVPNNHSKYRTSGRRVHSGTPI